MTTEAEMPVEDRILRVFETLGIQQAHLAGRTQHDWIGFVDKYPERVASLTLVCPGVPDPDSVSSLASRLLIFTGDQTPSSDKMRQVVASIPGATLATLDNYAAWSDVAAVHTDRIGSVLKDFLSRLGDARGEMTDYPADASGEVAGISYRILGSGPPLVLLPLGFSSSQWEPLLPSLAEDQCTITLGGAELGVAAALEMRGRLPGYVRLMRNLIDAARLQPGETVLEVGCGTGVLCRWLARYTNKQNPVVGLDFNPYLLREAEAFSRKEGLEGVLEFQEGNAEALTIADNSYGLSVSSTVMEEVDADRMLAEMVRVTKPGGKVAVAVRALDRPFLINLPLPAELKAKVENPGTWASDVAENGCADATLYRRFHKAGLTEVEMFPQLMAAGSPAVLEWLETWVLPMLSQEESEQWRIARAQAMAQGTYFFAWPHHCAVGTKIP